MIRLREAALAVLLAAIAGAPVLAQTAPARKPARAASAPATAPAPAAFVRELGGIQEYRLANGLQILLFPDAGQSTTSVNITYRVGSRFEGQGEFGMAHLLEHLQFKGTPSHRDIPDEFARRGVRYNGTTTVDRTSYVAGFNANDDTLAWTLALEADRMRNSFIARADLDKEMSVVRNEFERGENDPVSVLTKRVTSAAYTWHAYGHVPIGPRSDIENVPIENLQAFYHRWYRPDNATLLIAGKFDRDAALRLVARDFGPIARPPEAMTPPYTVEPAQDGERSVVVRRVGGQPVIEAWYHVPALAHPDSAAIVVYEMLMSLQPSGHLYQGLVASKQALGAGMIGLGGHDPGGVRAMAVLPPAGDVDRVQQRLLDLVEGRAAVVFTEADIERVRELAVVGYRQEMKDTQALMQQLSDVVGAGDWRLLFVLMDELPKVTLADVERVRAAYFRPANRTLGRYLPTQNVERVEIPAAPPLDQRLAGLKAPPSVADGETFVPTIPALAERTRRVVLPSGIVLQTLNKQTRGDAVSATIVMNWASQRGTVPLRGTTMVAELMGEGSTTRGRQQLQDALVKLHAGLTINSGNQFARVDIVAERDSLAAVMKLAFDVLRHPAFPADSVGRVRSAHLAAIEAGRKDLGTMMGQASRDHVNAVRGAKPGEPAYVPSVDDALAEYRDTTLDDVRGFYDRYWSANQAYVAVVGAVPDGLADVVEQGLGGWKKPGAPRYEPYEPRYADLGGVRFDVQVDDTTSASLRMWHGLALNRDDADYAPLLLAVHILGGGGLESRLNTRVRRELGLSYGAGARLAADFHGNDGGIAIEATFAPQNRDKVIAAIDGELALFGQDGPTEAELARAKHDILEGLQQSRSRDGELAAELNVFASLDRDWAWEGARAAALEHVTLAQVDDAWHRLMGDRRFMVTTGGDFKAITPATR
ncbi:M16 family metallopeptidase [Scleromatobacter humisilvae]|uniref:Insulinase family protein n=1 Tax=Scleromatobacter humisilvae TaxID=2897159 RepID=A0A9X2BXP8_9BURK|nr:M16 family metallopeptidase [Scleromatobacter humisilvae]MCK9684632.1 insulinase family protein [Scleromatobacter humisilvae]